MASDRPIFVVGCPRSGTTLLSLMIHAHPRLAMPPESRFLVSVWRDRQRFGDLGTLAQRRALARACTGRGTRIGHLGLDRKKTKAAILAAPPTLGSAFGTVFAEFARRHGKARWGDKRPSYFPEVDVLLRLFPDAQVVHIVRDPRATVASLKEMTWWPYDSVASMATWAQADYCARRDGRRLPADTFHVVRYESLVADPKATLARLCDFLAEDFHPAMLEPQHMSSLVPDGKTWHQRTRTPVSADRSEARLLEAWELGLLETVLARALRRHGYQPSGAGSRPSPRPLARYAAALVHRHAAMRWRWARERAADRDRSQPVAALLTSGQLAAAEEGRSRSIG